MHEKPRAQLRDLGAELLPLRSERGCAGLDEAGLGDTLYRGGVIAFSMSSFDAGLEMCASKPASLARSRSSLCA